MFEEDLDRAERLGNDFDPELAERPTRDQEAAPPGGIEEQIIRSSLVPDKAPPRSKDSLLLEFLRGVKVDENSSDQNALDRILEEINPHKDALFSAYLDVMMGQNTKPLRVQKDDEDDTLKVKTDSYTAKIDKTYEKFFSFKTLMDRSSNFFRCYLPDLSQRQEDGSLPSYSSAGIKYMINRDDPESICMGVEIPLDELTDMKIDSQGNLKYDRKRIHARPFMFTPVKKLVEQADHNRETYKDTSGRGAHLPTFVKLYTDLLAFAIQDHPVALAASIISKERPELASMLLAEQAKTNAVINSYVLANLGYNTRNGTNILDTLLQEIMTVGKPRHSGFKFDITLPGFTHFDKLMDWREHFCWDMVLVDFAESYLKGTEVKKMPDMLEYMMGKQSIPPPPVKYVKSF